MIQVRLPSGRVVPVNTDDPKVAAATARAFVARDPYERARAQGAAHPVAAAVETAARAIPGATEFQAGVNSTGSLIGDFLTGKQHLDPSDLAGSLGTAQAAAFKRTRASQQGLVDSLHAAHPIVSDLATGAAMAAPVAAAILSGGATEVPQMAAAGGRGISGFLKSSAVRGAKGAVTGAMAGAAYGATQPGDLSERLHSANTGALVGGVAGGALPVAGEVAGLAKDMAASAGQGLLRTANKVSGGALIDATDTAAQRLTEALRSDGATPDLIRTAMNGFLRNGATDPALIDVASRLPSGGENTVALIRAASAKGSARGIASTYADQVAADLQDKAIARTRALTPDRRSVPQIENDVSSRITTASAPPAVAPASGGAAVSAELNGRFDAGKTAINQAYTTAREMPGEAVLHPQAAGNVAQQVSHAMGDFDPLNVPRVAREVSRITDVVRPGMADLPEGLNPARVQAAMSTPTPIRPLFDARARLTQLTNSADPVEATAARRVVGALDSSINTAVDSGHIDGDPASVDAWRNAIGLRRQFGQQFEGNDLINAVTARTRHGAGQALDVAPEDASSAILGRNGVSGGPDQLRDLMRLRDTLGEQSPAWDALRREAQSRLLGADVGTEDFGQAWGGFAQQHPQLADLLMTPDEQRSLLWQRANVSRAVGDRAALNAGQDVLNGSPDEYAMTMEGVGHRIPLAQVGAARQLEDAIGAPTAGATGTLNRVSTGTNQSRNLAATFGPDEAAAYQAGLKDLTTQLRNARTINPNTGSPTAMRLADLGLVEPSDVTLPKLGPLHVVMGAINKVRAGATLTDAERAEIARIGTSMAGPDAINLSSEMTALPSQTLDSMKAYIAGLLPASQSTERTT